MRGKPVPALPVVSQSSVNSLTSGFSGMLKLPNTINGRGTGTLCGLTG